MAVTFKKLTIIIHINILRDITKILQVKQKVAISKKPKLPYSNQFKGTKKKSKLKYIIKEMNK